MRFSQENMIICKLRTWSRSEKIGVKFKARVSKELFGLIEDIELMELSLQGRKITWNNVVSVAKLDRFNWSCATDFAAPAPPLTAIRLPCTACPYSRSGSSGPSETERYVMTQVKISLRMARPIWPVSKGEIFLKDGPIPHEIVTQHGSKWIEPVMTHHTNTIKSGPITKISKAQSSTRPYLVPKKFL